MNLLIIELVHAVVESYENTDMKLNECIYEAKKIIKQNRSKTMAYEMFKKWRD